MTLQEFCDKVAHILKGTYVKATWQSVVPTPKSEGHVVLKTSTGIVRLGINYSHIDKVIREGKGGGALPGSDAWKYFPYVIEGKNGLKVRMTRTMRSGQTKTVYTVDGHEVSLPELEASKIVAPSSLKHYGDTPIFDVKLENLLVLGEKKR